ncbi:putative nucleotidyltransferase substrate binding domain-containing protein [Geomonas azotofigens]|uniref:putative nucleotidyltransferase substrate binding domain-containing protein n=1 Tax=Geomonas azotofigens TaxID=2843196 RepID=UPI001C12782A|nr:putative nucleotidyltransferase substrate binding domain-containing protein [Geomonas azotofigens]MBU5613278.1 nucleotidyltransferase [Geomonas azotofigens]
MPMLLGTKGDEILKWRASTELVASLKKRLESKWGSSSSREAEAFLGTLIGSFKEELAYEEQMDQELAALDQGIAEAPIPAALVPLQARYRELVSAHFRRRNSTLALCGACNALHDRVLLRAAQLAEERMRDLGQGTAPVYALLVSGDRGRGEQTLYGRNRYLLLHQLDSQRFYLFSRQLTQALHEAGLLAEGEVPWHGSLTEWRSLLKNVDRQQPPPPELEPMLPFAAAQKQAAPPLPEWRWRLESMADLCHVAGFEPLGEQALTAAAAALKEQRGRDPFFQLARRVINLPLALGHFGRWRLERGGEHQGEIDIETLGLSPLVQLVRILALQAEVHEGGTLERIRQLLYRGALDVDLAERLLKALQCLMQLRIEGEIRSEEAAAFANPEEFSMALDARLRSALEAVLSLQKIAYQRLVGQV